MEIKPRKYYKTRNGDKVYVGFKRKNKRHEFPLIGEFVDMNFSSPQEWRINGSFSEFAGNAKEHRYDLVSEWVEE